MRQRFLRAFAVAAMCSGGIGGSDVALADSFLPNMLIDPTTSTGGGGGGPTMPGGGVIPNATAASTFPVIVAPLINHNGPVLQDVTTKSIFWGAQWQSPAFAGGDSITGLDSFYSGLNGSVYASVADEYTGSNGPIQSNGLIYQGHVIDPSPTTNGIDNPASVLAEVCKQISNGNIVPDSKGNGYYPVYTAKASPSYTFNCGWHAFGSCIYNGQAISLQYAYFYGDQGTSGIGRCAAGPAWGGHSGTLTSLANESANAFNSVRTDPTAQGWWVDPSGTEMGNKCQATYKDSGITLANGSVWKIQSLWSNLAALAGTGQPSAMDGEPGCVTGN
jgi:hypothetical protein